MDIFNAKVQLVYDHVLTAYDDDGTSVYSRPTPAPAVPMVTNATVGPLDVKQIADDVVARILADPTFAALMAQQLQASPDPPTQ